MRTTRRVFMAAVILLTTCALLGGDVWAQAQAKGAAKRNLIEVRRVGGGVAQPRVVVRPMQPGEWQRRRQTQPSSHVRYYVESIMRAVKAGRKPSKYAEQAMARYLKTRLIDPDPMDDIDKAHYAVASIHLRQKQIKECIERLETVLEKAEKPLSETVWVTHLNLGILYAAHIGDIRHAMNEYRRVKGKYAPFARYKLLETLKGMDEPDMAVALFEEDYKAAKTRAEKLAVLQQLAQFHTSNKDYAKAVATYDRITREFTRAEVEKMKRDAAETPDARKMIRQPYRQK